MQAERCDVDCVDSVKGCFLFSCLCIMAST